MNDTSARCKLCRRAGKKLFLKGERCFSAKCAVVKKPYAPGQHSKPAGALSEYGKQLAQKQTLKRFYRLSERQFRKYFEASVKKEGKFSDQLIGSLETRLDNVVYRLGFSESRAEARQLVGHGFFLVNEKTVNIPSFSVKPGDQIGFRPSKESRTYLKNLREKIANKKKDVPAWLEVDAKSMTGKLVIKPTTTEINPEGDPQAIVEFYSR
jgi:small subunit ribosomal protein S4